MNKKQLSTAHKVAIGALVAMAIAHALGHILYDGEYPPLALAFELPLVILAGLAVRMRWALMSGVVLAGLLALLTLIGSLDLLLQFQAPQSFAPAGFILTGIVVVVAGLRALTLKGKAIIVGEG